VAAASTTTVDCRFADVELADPDRFVGSLPAEFGAACDSWRGASVLAVATAAGIPVWVGVAPADVVVSLLDGVELVGAPPDLFLIPERRSAVGGSVGEEVALAWAPPDLFLIPERRSAFGASVAEEVALAWASSTELCATRDVESDEESAAGADEFVDDVGSVDDVPAADSGDGLEADDDEPDDELEESDDEREELGSVGAANATPGVVATAPPTPSANASAPARIMYCAFTGIALRGQPARAPAERPPEPAWPA
jgi:hypothetical protein